MAIILTYGTACDVLDGDAEVGEEFRQAVHLRGLKTDSESRFRALLTEGASEVELV